MLPKSITLPDYTGEHSRYLQVGQQKTRYFLRFEKVASASLYGSTVMKWATMKEHKNLPKYNITP